MALTAHVRVNEVELRDGRTVICKSQMPCQFCYHNTQYRVTLAVSDEGGHLLDIVPALLLDAVVIE